MRKHGGKAEDVGFYCDGIREILLQPTEQHYIESINNKKKVIYQILNSFWTLIIYLYFILGYLASNGVQMPKWSAAFVEYYEQHIEIEIKGLAMFSIQPICKNLFNGITGITTNHSEGLNFIKKTDFCHSMLLFWAFMNCPNFILMKLNTGWEIEVLID